MFSARYDPLVVLRLHLDWSPSLKEQDNQACFRSKASRNGPARERGSDSEAMSCSLVLRNPDKLQAPGGVEIGPPAAKRALGPG
jgi:hypothetical protein